MNLTDHLGATDYRNQLLSVGGYATYAYDAIGQMSSSEHQVYDSKEGTVESISTAFEYDVTGKPVKMTRGSDEITFAYDDRGFRIRKYDSSQPTIEQVYVRDASGNVLPIYGIDKDNGNLLVSEYPIYGSGRVGTHYVTDDKETYEIKDHLGNVRSVMDDQGAVMSSREYYPFGMTMNRYGDPSSYRYGYQGDFAEEDDETGFTHFEARDYDPVIGRWMVIDPARQYPSPYVGMGNSPVMGVDPDGESTLMFSSNGTSVYYFPTDQSAINFWNKFWTGVIPGGFLVDPLAEYFAGVKIHDLNTMDKVKIVQDGLGILETAMDMSKLEKLKGTKNFLQVVGYAFVAKDLYKLASADVKVESAVNKLTDFSMFEQKNGEKSAIFTAVSAEVLMEKLINSGAVSVDDNFNVTVTDEKAVQGYNNMVKNIYQESTKTE